MTEDRSTEFEVTIALVNGPDDMTPAETNEIVGSMNAARDAAFAVLQATQPPMPLEVVSTISLILDLRNELRGLQPHGTRETAQRIRSEIFKAIDQLAVQFRWDQATIASPVPATLAAAIASAVRASDELDVARKVALERQHFGTDMSVVEAIEAFNTAFNQLKTRFEKEFPNGAH